jgi:hypothetical protein
MSSCLGHSTLTNQLRARNGCVALRKLKTFAGITSLAEVDTQA